MKIQSKSNQLVKELVKLQSKKHRDERGEFLIEGRKVILEAIKAGINIKQIYKLESSKVQFDGIDETYISNQVLNAVSTTKTPQDCVALASMRWLKDFDWEKTKRILVLDRIQDPSNLGAIMRSALGSNFLNIVMIDCVDCYDPKVLRSSMGAVFHLNLVKLSEHDVIEKCNQYGKNLVICDMNGESVFTCKQISDPVLVIGNEGNGVSCDFKKNASTILSIPMNEKLESLNASVSASIIMYMIEYTFDKGEK